MWESEMDNRQNFINRFNRLITALLALDCVWRALVVPLAQKLFKLAI
jgi:hypothetical protein